jgi:hypothetical protein
MIKRATKPEREGVEMAVIGAGQAPTLMAQLKQRNITVKDPGPLDEAGISALLQTRKVPGGAAPVRQIRRELRGDAPGPHRAVVRLGR